MLAISRAQTNDTGDYSIVAASQYGMTTSSVGRLEVVLPPAISISSIEIAPLTFETLPPAGNWFSAFQPGGTSITTTGQLDALVQTLEVAIITKWFSGFINR